MRIEIVSSEKMSYVADDVQMVVVPGVSGELGILPNHAPLLTQIKPGALKLHLADGSEELMYISGGLLEVQPDKVTILADVAQRSDELDEARADIARQAAEEKMQNMAHNDIDYAAAQAELAQTVAQLQAIRNIRKRTGSV